MGQQPRYHMGQMVYMRRDVEESYIIQGILFHPAYHDPISFTNYQPDLSKRHEATWLYCLYLPNNLCYPVQTQNVVWHKESELVDEEGLIQAQEEQGKYIQENPLPFDDFDPFLDADELP